MHLMCQIQLSPMVHYGVSDVYPPDRVSENYNLFLLLRTMTETTVSTYY